MLRNHLVESHKIGKKLEQPKNALSYYVDGEGGSDTYDGLSWHTAFATIGKACEAITARHVSGNYKWTGYWGQNDIIYIGGGLYAEALTAVPPGCTFIGLGNAFASQNEYSRTSVVWKPTTTNAAINQSELFSNLFYNIRFRGSGASKLIDVEEIENVYFEDCVWQGQAYGGATATTVAGIYVMDSWMFGGMKHCSIHDCKTGIHIHYDGSMTFHSFHNVVIDDLVIAGATTAGVYIHVDQNPSGSIVRNFVIGDGIATLALGIDDNTSQLHFANGFIQASANDPATASGGIYNNVFLNGALQTQS